MASAVSIELTGHIDSDDDQHFFLGNGVFLCALLESAKHSQRLGTAGGSKTAIYPCATNNDKLADVCRARGGTGYRFAGIVAVLPWNAGGVLILCYGNECSHAVALILVITAAYVDFFRSWARLIIPIE